MKVILKAFDGYTFLGARLSATKISAKAATLLKADHSPEILVDFEGVTGVSHSYADELLSGLADLLDEFGARVAVANCQSEVLGELRAVAALHDIPMPELVQA